MRALLSSSGMNVALGHLFDWLVKLSKLYLRTSVAGSHLAYSLISVFMAGSVMVTASAGTPVA